MKTHEIKAHPAMFDALRRGVKLFEVRKDDRAYQTGDRLRVKYFDPDDQTPPFAKPPMPEDKERTPMDFDITFVLRGGQYGVETGYVVLSLKMTPVEPPKAMGI